MRLSLMISCVVLCTHPLGGISMKITGQLTYSIEEPAKFVLTMDRSRYLKTIENVIEGNSSRLHILILHHLWLLSSTYDHFYSRIRYPLQ
jgi:hypothetical protein